MVEFHQKRVMVVKKKSVWRDVLWWNFIQGAWWLWNSVWGDEKLWTFMQGERGSCYYINHQGSQTHMLSPSRCRSRIHLGFLWCGCFGWSCLTRVLCVILFCFFVLKRPILFYSHLFVPFSASSDGRPEKHSRQPTVSDEQHRNTCGRSYHAPDRHLWGAHQDRLTCYTSVNDVIWIRPGHSPVVLLCGWLGSTTN